jgi:hypothetical protein
MTAGRSGYSRSITSAPAGCSTIASGPNKPSFPPWPPEPRLGLPFEPTAHAQRLEHFLGPEHLLIRLRTYREYPAEEQGRWRAIEL